jgi:hypothetical protein
MNCKCEYEWKKVIVTYIKGSQGKAWRKGKRVKKCDDCQKKDK